MNTIQALNRCLVELLKLLIDPQTTEQYHQQVVDLIIAERNRLLNEDSDRER